MVRASIEPQVSSASGAAHAAKAQAAAPEGVRASQEMLAAQRQWLAPFFVRHVSRREDAEDLVQDVLTKALGSLDRFRGECPFSQWVLAIARRTLINYYQRDPYRKGRLVAWPDDDSDPSFGPQRCEPEAGLSSVVEGKAIAERLLATMQQVCSADERRVIMMAYQGESLDAIGGILGKSASTVRSLYRRGRQKLVAHIVTNDTDLLGGREAIARAWAAAERASDSSDRPTPDEAQAWREPAGRIEAFRSACLKMARFLPLLAAAWILFRE